MAVSGTNLTAGHQDSATSATTASVSRNANELILLTVVNGTAGGANTAPDVPSGFTQVATYDSVGNQRVTVFRYLGSSISGAISLTFGGVSQAYIRWCVDSFSGIDISGTNGSGAIAQSTSGEGFSSSPSRSLTSPNAANASFGALGSSWLNSGDNPSAGSGYSLLGTDNNLAVSANTEVKAAASATVNFSLPRSGAWAEIAIEIKVASAAPNTSNFFLS